MTSTHRSVCLAAFVTVLGIAAACSSDSNPVAPKGECAVPTTSNFADSAQGRVVMSGTQFLPSNITIRKGMTVKWVYCEPRNTDSHTSTSNTGLWDSGLLGTGESFSRVFAAVGAFPYHCIPHPEMQATVTVID
jgi:plastocyanin